MPKYCLITCDGSHFPDLAKPGEIVRPGCYQWMQAFNSESAPKWTGEVRHVKTLAAEDYETFDILHLNICGVTLPLFPKVKELIKNSSTVLIANQDYSAENLQAGIARPKDFYNALKLSDFLFTQDPVATKFVNLLLKHHMKRDKMAALIPHPCDMRLKKYKLDYEQRIDLIGICYHRYRDELLIPSMLTWGLKYPTVIFGLTRGNIPVGLFHFTASMLDWGKYLYCLAHCSLAFDYVGMYHCMGRYPMELACLGTPAVCTDTIYAGKKLYPMTTYEATDYEGLRSGLKKLIENQEFYEKVSAYAFENVEYFGWKPSLDRLREGMESWNLKPGF